MASLTILVNVGHLVRAGQFCTFATSQKKEIRIIGKERLNGVGSDESLKCHNILTFLVIS